MLLLGVELQLFFFNERKEGGILEKCDVYSVSKKI